MNNAIRPGIDTLRELRDGQVLDEFSMHLHDAVSAVQALGKPAEVSITIKVKPFSKTRVMNPALAFEAEVTSKLPKPDREGDIFFVDDNGNPTRNQTRQSDLTGLKIAGDDDTQARSA